MAIFSLTGTSLSWSQQCPAVKCKRETLWLSGGSILNFSLMILTLITSCRGLRGSPQAGIQAHYAAAAATAAVAPCIFSSVQVCLNDTVSPHACKWRNCLALLCVCPEEWGGGGLKCSTSQLWQLRKLKKECGGGGKKRSSWHDWYTCVS